MVCRNINGGGGEDKGEMGGLCPGEAAAAPLLSHG